MMTDAPYVLGGSVPEVCPYCGAKLKSNSNPKHKYREFQYECGAIGEYCEFYQEHFGKIEFLYVDDEANWTTACSVAEQDFRKTWFEQKRTVRIER